MAKRSLTACPAGIETATTALTDRGWSREDLAARVVIEGKSRATTGIGIGTVKKFFGGGSLDRKYFVGICRALGLDWEAIAGLKGAEPEAEEGAGPKAEGRSPSKAPQQASIVYDLRGAKFGGGAAMGGGQQSGGVLNDHTGSKGTNALDIDALVQTVREKVHDNIQHRCGTMRVPDMTQRIGLTDIYTSVNILEKITGRRWLGRNELLQNLDLEDFDRFMLGGIREKRVPALEAVENHEKLMILGKPGAGKTTFLKRLAILCNHGQFRADAVPMFVTLKDFAETDGQPSLLTYIGQQLNQCWVEDGASAAETVLRAGRSLVLLDGLDEVQESDYNRVLREIRNLYNQFHRCRFVMTCRIAVREYTFEPFVEVEVADFDDEQIAEFVTKWFQLQEDPIKAETFLERLKNDKPIRELASSPLLLTLLCLVFQDAADFPRNRAWLYKEGLDVLLKKWDAKRNIERDQVYKKLSLQRKEDLLSQIAFETFERSEYFFEQSEVERQIRNYIQNLPEISTEPEALQLDSEAVLKSVEAQHGLLVKRARGIYSFSHLTFQEYFTASYIISPDPEHLQQRLQSLATYVSDKRWREVFLFLPGMMRTTNPLVRLMKRETDQLLAAHKELQQLLAWLSDKSSSFTNQRKDFEVREFYKDISLDIYTLNGDKNLKIEHYLDLCSDVDIDYNLEFDLYLDLNLFYALKSAISQAKIRRYLDDDFSGNTFIDLDTFYAINLSLALGEVFNLDITSKIKETLQVLKDKLPEIEHNHPTFQQWWQSNGKAWTEQLRAVMIEHRNIGHDWKFTDEQKELLQQYYDANALLIECLNSDCYITNDVREEIEDTLFLPIAEIEARKAKA